MRLRERSNGILPKSRQALPYWRSNRCPRRIHDGGAKSVTVREQPAAGHAHFYGIALSGFLLIAASSLSAAPGGPESAHQGTNDSDASAQDCDLSMLGSPYIPVDSWIYPAVLRLYSLGF